MSANLQLFSETDKQNQKNFKIENSHWKMNGKTYQELEESEKRAYIEALEVERYNQCVQTGIIAKDYLHLLCIRMANNAFSPKPKTGKFYPNIDKILKYIYTYCNYECECDTNFLIDDEAYEGCFLSANIYVNSFGKIEVTDIKIFNEDDKEGFLLPRQRQNIEEALLYNLWTADNRDDSLNGWQQGE